jgi:hypothetical protein
MESHFTSGRFVAIKSFKGQCRENFEVRTTVESVSKISLGCTQTGVLDDSMFLIAGLVHGKSQLLWLLKFALRLGN